MVELDHPITIEHDPYGHITIGDTKIPAAGLEDSYKVEPLHYGTRVTLTLITTGPVKVHYPAAKTRDTQEA